MNAGIGSLGVTLLLVAFVMNLLKQWREDNLIYLALNAIGAGLACAYAVLSGMIPFVILEGVWALFAAIKMAGVITKKAPA